MRATHHSKLGRSWFVCSFMPAAYPFMAGSPEKLRFGSGMPGFPSSRPPRLVCWDQPKPLIRAGTRIGLGVGSNDKGDGR